MPTQVSIDATMAVHTTDEASDSTRLAAPTPVTVLTFSLALRAPSRLGHRRRPRPPGGPQGRSDEDVNDRVGTATDDVLTPTVVDFLSDCLR